MAGLLSGKIAFVTGAGSGIGRAACVILARDGANVIAADKNGKSADQTVQLINNTNGTHRSLAVDVADSISVKSALAKSIEFFKEPPNVIVNCAGITRDNFLLKLSEADFQDVLDINLKGTFMILQTFSNAIVEQKISNASIINIGSIVGKNANVGQANYSASKAGVEMLTKTAAKEFGKHGIRVNVILPGFIKTPMTQVVPDKIKQMFISQIPLGRMGDPEEIAELISFLASDKSSYINGASIAVTGGMV